MSKYVGKHIDLQSIDFQSGSFFFKELINFFEDLKKLKDSDEFKNGILDVRLSDIIKHHTGLSVKIEYNNAWNDFSIEVPIIDKNNILIPSRFIGKQDNSNFIETINNSDKIIKGTIDINNGKVTGVFSELESLLNLPDWGIFTNLLNADETAAIVLHELGHLFTFFELITRTLRTNQALSSISNALIFADSPKKREVIFATAKKALKISTLDTESLSEIKDSVISETIIISSIVV